MSLQGQSSMQVEVQNVVVVEAASVCAGLVSAAHVSNPMMQALHGLAYLMWLVTLVTLLSSEC
jgi:hypothetical protein